MKFLEIRDNGTNISAVAFRLNPVGLAACKILSRSGYGLTLDDMRGYIMLAQLCGGTGKITCDPAQWNTRPMDVAHDWIIKNYNEIESGDVVDVRFILGESTKPCVSDTFSGF